MRLSPRISLDCSYRIIAVSMLVTGCSTDKAVQLPPAGGTGVSPATQGPETGPGSGQASADQGAGVATSADTDRADGQACEKGKQCSSGHCDNGLCCSGGDCCKLDTDCGGGGNAAACEDPEKCQGIRGKVSCVRNRCRVQDGDDDDTACDASVEADDCGFFKSVMCNGDASQRAPRCPTSCSGDDDCDTNARCRDGDCIEAEPNGGACEVASDCASHYCGQGVCCERGDCCTEDRQCPGSYSTPATCDSMSDCQGTRGAASCVDFMCETTKVDDDSACGPRALAHDCTGAADVYCTGAANQRASRDCDTNCRWDGDCSGDQHCAEYACIPDLDNGEGCDRAAACQSGYCGGNYGQPSFCCGEGACCQTDENCIGRYVCDDRFDCQGTRYEQACSPDFSCEDVPDGEEEPNDSGCVGQLSSTCGSNRDAYCSIASDQIRPWCESGGTGRCSGNRDCDAWLECRDGYCQTPPREDN